MGNAPDNTSGSEFDRFAGDYASLHQRNIAISGEEPAYFADYKLHCVERLVGSNFREPVLDFGCGIGMLTERLSHRFSEVHGYDPSSESLNIARGKSASTFHEQESLIPDRHFSLAILANVLHHVAPSDRNALVRRVASKLREGSGRLVVFEHNPINPLTRYVVSRCEFDTDAVLLWPWQLNRLLTLNGFTSVSTKYIVFFPGFLAGLRRLEPYLGWLPLGAQMMVVGSFENDRSNKI
jgi:SAM-dependent methyltransferase